MNTQRLRVCALALPPLLIIFAGCSTKGEGNRPAVGGATSSSVASSDVVVRKEVEDPRLFKAEAPKDAIEIYAIAKQWLWKFQHPNGIREINELHVPVGQAFKVIIISEDIIHRLSIPDLRLAIDALPGKYSSGWAIASKVGRYSFRCDEYCGTHHAKHQGTLIVMERDDYEKWQKGIPADKAADGSAAWKGRQLFLKKQCIDCHTGGALAKGPQLEGLFGKSVALKGGVMRKVDEDYLRQSIRDPKKQVREGWQPIMPAFDKSRLSDEDLAALITFLRSLQAGDAPRREEPPPPKP